MSKLSLRKELLTKLAALSNDDILSLNFRLTEQLEKLFSSFPELSQKIGGAYLPLKAEVAPVYQEFLKQFPVKLAYPILHQGQMLFGIPNGMPKGTIWLEPPFSLTTPEWVLVPGVGFDLNGARLGRGKGYYDRYLETFLGLKIGLAASLQLVTEIPVESHDCHMDFIITEKFCWNVKQQKKF